MSRQKQKAGHSQTEEAKKPEETSSSFVFQIGGFFQKVKKTTTSETAKKIQRKKTSRQKKTQSFPEAELPSFTEGDRRVAFGVEAGHAHSRDLGLLEF